MRDVSNVNANATERLTYVRRIDMKALSTRPYLDSLEAAVERASRRCLTTVHAQAPGGSDSSPRRTLNPLSLGTDGTWSSIGALSDQQRTTERARPASLVSLYLLFMSFAV